MDRRPARTGALAGAAALIAALTVVSRLAGFGRILVFNATVGADSLGDVYQAANVVPNVIFEVVAGGALASIVVPLLVTHATAGDRPAVSRAVSAMLTWVLALMVPLAVVVAVAAGPLVRLIARDATPVEAAVGTDMLRVFAPQLPLYGVGIVLTGVLQAYRRFAWPVIAPLMSSLTVMVAYGSFALVAGKAHDVGTVGRGPVLILSLGTTAAVAVLTLCLLIPLRGTGLRPRLRWRFAEAATVRRLALAGALTVGAQQVSVGVAIALAYAGPPGSVVLYTLAQTIFLLPWAVLALPVATSTYPALAQAGAVGDDETYRRTLAPAVRSTLLLCSLGVAALVALAEPMARLLVAVSRTHPAAEPLALAIAAFAPGLYGYGLFALLSRALYARLAPGTVAASTALGWGTVVVASLVLSAALPPGYRVAALALANSVGLTVLGVALLVMVRRRAGTGAVTGWWRALGVGVVAGTAAAGASAGVRVLGWGTTTPGPAGTVWQGMLCGFVVLGGYLSIAAALDSHDVRPLVAAATRRLRRCAAAGRRLRRGPSPPGPAGPEGSPGGAAQPARQKEAMR